MQDYNLDRTVGVGVGFFGCVSHRVVIFDTSILIILSVLLPFLFFFQRFFLSPYSTFQLQPRQVHHSRLAGTPTSAPAAQLLGRYFFKTRNISRNVINVTYDFSIIFFSFSLQSLHPRPRFPTRFLFVRQSSAYPFFSGVNAFFFDYHCFEIV